MGAAAMADGFVDRFTQEIHIDYMGFGAPDETTYSRETSCNNVFQPIVCTYHTAEVSDGLKDQQCGTYTIKSKSESEIVPHDERAFAFCAAQKHTNVTNSNGLMDTHARIKLRNLNCGAEF